MNRTEIISLLGAIQAPVYLCHGQFSNSVANLFQFYHFMFKKVILSLYHYVNTCHLIRTDMLICVNSFHACDFDTYIILAKWHQPLYRCLTFDLQDRTKISREEVEAYIYLRSRGALRLISPAELHLSHMRRFRC